MSRSIARLIACALTAAGPLHAMSAEAADYEFRVPLNLDFRNVPNNQVNGFTITCRVFTEQGNPIGSGAKSILIAEQGGNRQVTHGGLEIAVNLEQGRQRSEVWSYECRLSLLEPIANSPTPSGAPIETAEFAARYHAQLQNTTIRAAGRIIPGGVTPGPGGMTAPARPRGG